MTRPAADLTWRRATPHDAAALRDLECDANRVGLAHVFGERPFPTDDVLARWVLVLHDPEVVTEVACVGDRLRAVAAHDGASLRHLAVHPSDWGSGLGAAGVARAVGAGATRLWVLEPNHRARALYERLGWAPTGLTQDSPWPPHPIELEYGLERTP